jgi:hypothetical protein
MGEVKAGLPSLAGWLKNKVAPELLATQTGRRSINACAARGLSVVKVKSGLIFETDMLRQGDANQSIGRSLCTESGALAKADLVSTSHQTSPWHLPHRPTADILDPPTTTMLPESPAEQTRTRRNIPGAPGEATSAIKPDWIVPAHAQRSLSNTSQKNTQPKTAARPQGSNFVGFTKQKNQTCSNSSQLPKPKQWPLCKTNMAARSPGSCGRHNARRRWRTWQTGKDRNVWHSPVRTPWNGCHGWSDRQRLAMRQPSQPFAGCAIVPSETRTNKKLASRAKTSARYQAAHQSRKRHHRRCQTRPL